MSFLKIFGISVFCIFGFMLLIFHIKSRRPIRSIILNGVIGLAALMLINFTTKFTGVHIPINWWSVAGSGIFGIPAVCTLLILQMIF